MTIATMLIGSIGGGTRRSRCCSTARPTDSSRSASAFTGTRSRIGLRIRLVDRLGQLAHRAMEAAERDLKDRHAQRAARDRLRNYRKLAEAEAQILVQTVHPS